MTSGPLSTSMRNLQLAAAPKRGPISKAAADPRKPNSDDDARKCMIRADVIKLHSITTRTRSHSDKAALEGESQPIDEQISKASSSAPSVCGDLVELLLSKAMDALSYTLKDIDASNSVEQSYSGSGSLSLVGPLLAALDRLRLFHEKEKLARSSNRKSTPPVSLRKVSTCEAASQTNDPSTCSSSSKAHACPYPAGGTCAVPKTVTKDSAKGSQQSYAKTCPSSRSTAVQVCRNDFESDAGCQSESMALVQQLRSRCEPLVDNSSQTIDESKQKHMCDAETQVIVNEDSWRSVHTQTETQHSTVRIVRMARAQRLAQSTPELVSPQGAGASSSRASDEPPAKSEGADPQPEGRTADAQSMSKAGRRNLSRDRNRGQRSHSKTRQVSSANQTTDQASAEVKEKTALRCPAGHGMQWIRSRCQNKSDGSASDALLQCGKCFASIPSSASFHSCAVCFRDSGERHAVCSTCSRAVQGPELLSGSSWRSSKEGLNEMVKSASAGSLPIAHGQSPRTRWKMPDMKSTATDWSAVSSMLPAPSRPESKFTFSDTPKLSRQRMDVW